MLIEYLTGPKQGQRGHVERSQASQLLIDCGLLKEVPIAAPASKQPTWSIVLLGEGTQHQRYALRVDYTGGRNWFEGPPSGPTWESLSRQFGSPEPALVERYERLRRLPDFDTQLAIDEQRRNRLAARSRQ